MVGKGKILISEPYLGDPNFERTVILLSEDNEDGTLGFVLNKPSILTVDAVLTELAEFTDTVYIGGPVAQDSVHFLYTGTTTIENSLEIAEGVYWGGSYEHLVELANLKLVDPADFRFFLGYSGWGEGQLDDEMTNNSWIVGNTPAHDVLKMEPGKMWQEILKNMGGKYKMYSNFPIDPRLN